MDIFVSNTYLPDATNFFMPLSKHNHYFFNLASLATIRQNDTKLSSI